MSEDIVQIESITQLHNMLDHERPKHPLISHLRVILKFLLEYTR